MKKAYILIFLAMLTASTVNAQRLTDNLDRGLVAVNMDGSTFLSWRILADEYFGTTYNVYRDGTKIAEGLTVSNYTDSSVGTNYTVRAVVNGVEKTQSAYITSLWPSSARGNNVDMYISGRIDLALTPVYDRNGNDVTANYSPNDAEFADLDGDGQLEMIIKRLNTVDAANVYPQSNTTEFVMLDAYDINWQTGMATLMWRIDCGPNMVSLNSTEINIIAFDWDMDGKAEVVLRGADNMIVYGTDGKIPLYTIGDMSVNTRDTFNPANGAQYAWTHTGAEYLIYMNGQTGALYQQMEYPLKRLEYASNLSDEWGGRGYGHNSSKYFFGAPYLDGHTPNLFLARGIYGTHKMIAMNLNKNNHTWSERWRWKCNDTSSPWYGQGYHNFIVADVDEDGRDEIVYGSMVIDDNGKGLYTTGYGHGDAQHVSDFNPYRKGMEFMGCLEDAPYYGCNYRDAATGEVLYKLTATGDDGRCMMANISNNYPGSLGHSAASQTISSVTNGEVSDASSIFHFKTTNISLNFRIYWDGDLLSELLDSPGTMSSPMIFKPEVGRLLTGAVGNMNNDSKNNPCFQGDLIGDWREEIVVRSGTNAVSIYTSIIPSENPIPCLWLDHQYRQAMVWQMMAYNQPPHLSYFLGEMEGYTQAPPPLTTKGREVIGNNTNIDGNYNGKHVLHNEYDNTSISISGGSPAVLTINVPAWVQGHDNNNNITTTSYSCNLTGGAMSGETRLVKQGNGILNMSNAVHTNSGATDIWGGTVNFDGTMQNSPVWMNRHTTLNTNDGYFNNGLTMEYGATLNVGGDDCSRVNISELTLNYGARVVLDVNGMGDAEHDWLNATTLNIDDSKVGVSAWENFGPKYIVPVLKLNMSSTLGNGRYPIGNVTTVNGDLSRVKIECAAINASNLRLIHEDGILYLQVSDVATANEASIEITNMVPYETVNTLYPSTSSDNYYLPVVSIVANNTDGQAPTLSGTFTSLDGTETSIGSNEEREIFNEDFEEAESIDDINNWTIGSYKYLNNDATYGQYLNIASENSGGNRRSYKTFYATGNNFYGSAAVYTIEFDALFHRTNTDNINELVLFGEGATMPAVADYFKSTGNYYLFRLTGGNNNTNYAVEGSETTASIGDSWCHYTINVNKSTRTVSYSVKKGGTTVLSGNYIANETANMNIQGIGVVVGRAWSYFYIDNIVIKSAGDDMSSYTFTEPGTLRVYSSVDGYASGIKTFEAKYPFIKTGNSGSISNDYLPVAIHDEQATTLPQTVSTTGNAHLWRNGLTSTSTWATMVVPFDMTVAQVREVFGNEVTVANLETGKGNGGQIYFETIEVETANDNITAITANEPCLIKGVTKSAPYLIMGITSAPTLEPFISNGYFSFVGTYTDLGQKAFTTDDYFFTTSGLSRVETDGITMRFKGYRGYFQGLTANGAKNVQTVFEDSGVATEILDIPTSTRNEVYDLQGRKIPENWRLQKGVYIVNGRKVIVK